MQRTLGAFFIAISGFGERLLGIQVRPRPHAGFARVYSLQTSTHEFFRRKIPASYPFGSGGGTELMEWSLHYSRRRKKRRRSAGLNRHRRVPCRRRRHTTPRRMRATIPLSRPRPVVRSGLSPAAHRNCASVPRRHRPFDSAVRYQPGPDTPRLCVCHGLRIPWLPPWVNPITPCAAAQ